MYVNNKERVLAFLISPAAADVISDGVSLSRLREFASELVGNMDDDLRPARDFLDGRRNREELQRFIFSINGMPATPEAGKKIQAIKILREFLRGTGMDGLKECADMITYVW